MSSELDIGFPSKAKGPVSRPLGWWPYCDRGTCGSVGAAGAAGAAGGADCSCCRKRSSTPPPVPLGGSGCCCCAGELEFSMMERGLRSIPAMIESRRLVAKKPAARIAVARVSTLAVPRLVMKPPVEPMPSPPPSDFCSSTTPIMEATSIKCTTMRTLCITCSNPCRTAPAVLRPAGYRVSRARLHDPRRDFHPCAR